MGLEHARTNIKEEKEKKREEKGFFFSICEVRSVYACTKDVDYPHYSPISVQSSRFPRQDVTSIVMKRTIPFYICRLKPYDQSRR